jgi:cytochrome P450
VTHRNDVERVLADPKFEVPAVAPGDQGLAWLRSAVSRFVNGPEHARRRALVEAELDRLDPAALRRDARLRTEAVLARADGRIEAMAKLARPVPLAALGSALGIGEGELDQAVADAVLVGPVYLSGAVDGDVDAAVDRLRRALVRDGSEETAAAIAVLAQACEATAALIGNAIVLASEEPHLRGDADVLLDAALRRAAPVRLMRRVSPAGEPVTLDIDAAGSEAGPGDPPMTFGSGLRPCPAPAQAIALAAGVVDAVLPRCRCEPGLVTWADLPALRQPDRLELEVEQPPS